MLCKRFFWILFLSSFVGIYEKIYVVPNMEQRNHLWSKLTSPSILTSTFSSDSPIPIFNGLSTWLICIPQKKCYNITPLSPSWNGKNLREVLWKWTVMIVPLATQERLVQGSSLRIIMGEFIHAIASPLGEGTNNSVETEAVIIGINWCLENNFNKIHLEADSSLLIHWINKATKSPWNLCKIGAPAETDKPVQPVWGIQVLTCVQGNKLPCRLSFKAQPWYFPTDTLTTSLWPTNFY